MTELGPHSPLASATEKLVTLQIRERPGRSGLEPSVSSTQNTCNRLMAGLSPPSSLTSVTDQLETLQLHDKNQSSHPVWAPALPVTKRVLLYRFLELQVVSEDVTLEDGEVYSRLAPRANVDYKLFLSKRQSLIYFFSRLRHHGYNPPDTDVRIEKYMASRWDDEGTPSPQMQFDTRTGSTAVSTVDYKSMELVLREESRRKGWAEKADGTEIKVEDWDGSWWGYEWGLEGEGKMERAERERPEIGLGYVYT
ncbi:hypothetical protein BJ508DRAFT_336277 [Ascobolus immersus RN42]|uniref:Uncharacterized protein n=1 Tax=Ascobolus immersus RN42 TaxID=1160509 RepID=A0A3N4H923_ASCIM|nr:hypothetical protein BJ508DRAFT_336277 [Ascobolus immersus RN42]